MLSAYIKIGDRIEIKNKNNLNKDEALVSKVEDISDEKNIVVLAPVSGGRIVMLKEDAAYSFLFFTEKGMINFDVKFCSHYVDGGFNLMNITLISEGERVQRRDFFRYNCLLPLKFSIIDNDTVEKALSSSTQTPSEKSRTMRDAIIKDLGGGGIRFVCNEDIPEEKNIRCVIMINKELLITVGKVLHKQYFPRSNFKYQYRVRFIGILPEEQERIVQYIFTEQRKLLIRM